MHDKRLTTRLIHYWERMRASQPFPAYVQWNTAAIDDIWQNCLALHAQPSAGDSLHYIYVHCGETVAQALGRDVRGEVMSTRMRFFPGARIIKRVDEVVSGAAPCPILDDGQFVNDKGKVIKYRACLLSFGEKQAVTHVVIGVSWRAF